MNREKIQLHFAIICLLFVAACAAEPIHKVDNISYGYHPKPPLTVVQLQGPIERVATRNGWQLSNQKPGSFTGKRIWGGGKHSIVVDVIYNDKNFSINYRDSTQMKYDGSWIHHTYNRMVQELEDDIRDTVDKLYKSSRKP